MHKRTISGRRYLFRRNPAAHHARMTAGRISSYGAGSKNTNPLMKTMKAIVQSASRTVVSRGMRSDPFVASDLTIKVASPYAYNSLARLI